MYEVDNLTPPEDPHMFFEWLKKESEIFWKDVKLNSSVYGFQMQPGTKWLQGMSEDEIHEYEIEVGFDFPNIYKVFLMHMNGTDAPRINTYAGREESPEYSSGYYSFPRDKDTVQGLLGEIGDDFNILKSSDKINTVPPRLIPLISHRFLVANQCKNNPILSIHGTDVIVYADSLQQFLLNDIFFQHKQQSEIQTKTVPFWLP